MMVVDEIYKGSVVLSLTECAFALGVSERHHMGASRG